MLGVHILHTFQAAREPFSCTAEEGTGLEEFGYAAGSGRWYGLKRVVVVEKLRDQ